MHKHLLTAMELATSNTYDKHIDYHLAAIIVGGGSIISQGFNKANTNGFVEHYTDKVVGKRNWSGSTHAEMDAVLACRRKTDLRGCKVFVARRRLLNGQPAMSRPCAICESVLRSYGIKRAYYTIDESHYGIMTITNSHTFDKIIRV